MEASESAEKAVQREKDLRRHFKREAGKGADPRAPAASGTVDWPEWSGAKELKDRQLRAALSYLHRQAGSTPAGSPPDKRAATTAP